MLKPRWTGNVLDRRHGPLPLLAVPSASRLLTPSLTAATLPGHPEGKRTKKYSDWKEALFSVDADEIHLKGDVRFWACDWSPDRSSIWSNYGSTRLAFEEYLLIGVASDLFPNDLLNREGRNR